MLPSLKSDKINSRWKDEYAEIVRNIPEVETDLSPEQNRFLFIRYSLLVIISLLCKIIYK